MQDKTFTYEDCKFADIQMLRYRLNGFSQLSVQQKKYIYYLSQAALAGRDITTDQFGKYNLLLRKTLETIFLYYDGDKKVEEWNTLHTYLRQIWFANGVYHHYSNDKFIPHFSPTFFHQCLTTTSVANKLRENGYTDIESLYQTLYPILFDVDFLPKKVNLKAGEDLISTSACNYYENVNQEEVEAFYQQKKLQFDQTCQPSWGLNSKLVKTSNGLEEHVWSANGLYAAAIQQIIYWLEQALPIAENQQQKDVITLLIRYYQTGDLKVFDQYSIAWVENLEGDVDFINGFIEVYSDPLGIKASWEGIVHYTDFEANRRTELISEQAQWFEDHSPIDKRFKKDKVVGVSAKVVCAAMLGGDEYPSTAIGINLPNADWIRSQHGSKSITIGNLTEAYSAASRHSGFYEAFVIDEDTIQLINQYGHLTDDLHTDLHECLGHGSGKLLPGVDPDSLKSYGSTIEEARADLFALYYMADDKLVEMGILPNKDAYKAQYYTYLMNGLLTQLTRIKLGDTIEEAHMRNRALIARWVLEHGKDAITLIQKNNQTYLLVKDYTLLRACFAQLLAEIQRIKSEGDWNTAKKMVEKYAVDIDATLHQEIINRYEKLHLSPYKGFINPTFTPVVDSDGQITDIEVRYDEGYDEQMLRYSKEFGFLI